MMSRLHAVVGSSLVSAVLLFSGTALADGSCVLTCPANVTVATAPGVDTAPYSWVVSTSGTCGGVVQTSGIPSGGSFAVGTTTNTFQAVDPPNQSCQFNITVTATPALPITPVPALDNSALGFLGLMLALLGIYAAKGRKQA
jgi:hypothetical protein